MTTYTGVVDSYRWICRYIDRSVFDPLLDCIPEVIVDRYVVVSAFDSGPLPLNEDELRGGWTTRGDCAFSPLVADPAVVPRAEFDEWWTFRNPPRMSDSIDVFVNFCGFMLADPSERIQRTSDRAWDRAIIENESDRIELFWSQLRRLAPESYLNQGDSFVFASCNHELFKRVEAFIRGMDAA